MCPSHAFGARKHVHGETSGLTAFALVDFEYDYSSRYRAYVKIRWRHTLKITQHFTTMNMRAHLMI